MKPDRLAKTIAQLAGILIVLGLAWTLRLRAVERLPIDFDEDDYLRAGQQFAFAILTPFPLLFQFAVSLTDFNASSIRDGFQGGIWRAVWEGLTGQIPAMSVDLGTRFNQVNYVGLEAYPAVFAFITGSPDGWRSILFFNILWTILSVLFQGALGVAVALLLWQRGVRLSKFWQTLFIFPWAIPEMIGATMWLNVFQRDWGWLSLAADKYGPDSLFGSLEALSLSSPSFWLVTLFQVFFFQEATQATLSYNVFNPSGFNSSGQFAITATINIVAVIILIGFIVLFNRWSKAEEGVSYT